MYVLNKEVWYRWYSLYLYWSFLFCTNMISYDDIMWYASAYGNSNRCHYVHTSCTSVRRPFGYFSSSRSRAPQHFAWHGRAFFNGPVAAGIIRTVAAPGFFTFVSLPPRLGIGLTPGCEACISAGDSYWNMLDLNCCWTCRWYIYIYTYMYIADTYHIWF